MQAALKLSDPPWRLAGPGAILLVHAYSMYVYFYLFTRAGLARLDAALLEAAASLGANRWRTLYRVTLPLLRPALAGAALLTFMTALASFSAPYLFGGGFRVMTTQIVASKLNGELGLAQVETVMLALLALLGLRAMRRADRVTSVGTGVRGIAPARRRLQSPLARGLAGFFGWLLAAFLLLPHAVLALVSLVPPFTWTAEFFPPVLNLGNWGAMVSQSEKLRPMVNSLWMAVVATVLALGLGFAAARFAAARKGDRVGGLLEWMIAIPWAVPGTVFAVALATTFSANQPWLGRFVLIGTPWILPLAYLVRNLPLTGRAALAGLRQLDPSLEEAAASLGAGRWRRLVRVTLPLLRPALAAGARPRLHHRPRGLRGLHRPLYLRHPPHLHRDPLQPAPAEPGDGGGLWRPSHDRERRGLPALGAGRGILKESHGVQLAQAAFRPHGHRLRGHDRLPHGAADHSLLRQGSPPSSWT